MKLLTAIWAVLWVFAVGEAQAQDFTIQSEWLLEAEDGQYTWGYGPSSPSVVYDTDNEEYVMFFEVRLLDADAEKYSDVDGSDDVDYLGCKPNPSHFAVYAIGRATSQDGRTNWQLSGVDFDGDSNPDPVILPTKNTWYSCHAAQPMVVIDNFGTWHMWFKGQQENAVEDRPAGCQEGSGEDEPSWGCLQQTGIGYASSEDGITWTPRAAPVLTIDDLGGETSIGFPRVVSFDNSWFMYLTRVPEIFLAYSDEPDSGWTFVGTDEPDSANPEPPSAAMIGPQEGGQAWLQGRAFNASVVCSEDENAFPYFPFRMFFGGKDEAQVEQGLGWAYTYDESGGLEGLSDVSYAWTPFQAGPGVKNPIYSTQAGGSWFEWAEDTPQAQIWKQWDALSLGTQDYALYFAVPHYVVEVDELVGVPPEDGTPGRKSRIGLASTVTSWSAADVNSKVCFGDVPMDTGEPGDTGDGTDTGDTIGPSDTGELPCDTSDPDCVPVIPGNLRGGCACRSVAAPGLVVVMLFPAALVILGRRGRDAGL